MNFDRIAAQSFDQRLGDGLLLLRPQGRKDKRYLLPVCKRYLEREHRAQDGTQPHRVWRPGTPLYGDMLRKWQLLCIRCHLRRSKQNRRLKLDDLKAGLHEEGNKLSALLRVLQAEA